MGGSPRPGVDKKSKCKGRRGATLAPPALQMGTRNRTSLAAPGPALRLAWWSLASSMHVAWELVARAASQGWGPAGSFDKAPAGSHAHWGFEPLVKRKW